MISLKYYARSSACTLVRMKLVVSKSPLPTGLIYTSCIQQVERERKERKIAEISLEKQPVFSQTSLRVELDEIRLLDGLTVRQTV